MDGKGRDRRTPQEKGIPLKNRFLNKHHQASIQDNLSVAPKKPSFYNFYYIACAVTGNSYEPSSPLSIKLDLKSRHMQLSQSTVKRAGIHRQTQRWPPNPLENIQLKGAKDWEASEYRIQDESHCRKHLEADNTKDWSKKHRPPEGGTIAPQLSDYKKKPATTRENRAQTA